jgi:anti-sigma regulatory factor (Ser/Thr protein kinase)
MDGPERTVVDLGPSMTSAGVARTALREQMAGLPDDVVDAACLLVAEVVANVLLHVGAASRLVIVRSPTELRVEVSDRSPQEPTRRTRRPDRLTGRGLHLLDELATEWGFTTHGGGKTVWFTILLA